MEKLILKAKTRSGRAKDIRKDSLIPAIFYGKKEKNQSLEVDYHDFRRAFEKAGYNTIVELEIDDKKKVPVLIHRLDLHPVKDVFTHIDFYAVKMDEEISTNVPFLFIGTAPAVKDFGGILMHNKDSVSVKCLPKDLVHEIEVDVSGLIDFHCSITLEQIEIPKTLTVLDSLDTVIATVAAPRKAVEEEEEEAIEGEEGEAAEGEATEGEAKEGEKSESSEG